MAKFIYVYHGAGTPPATPEEGQAMMAAWGAWIGDTSTVTIGAGAPVGKSSTVSASGVKDDGGANPVSGYGLVEAPDLAAAIEKAKSCPLIQAGGTVEIAPEVQM